MVDQGLYIGINGWWAILTLLCHSSWTAIVILTMAGHICNPCSNEVAKYGLCSNQKKYIHETNWQCVCWLAGWGRGVFLENLL